VAPQARIETSQEKESHSWPTTQIVPVVQAARHRAADQDRRARRRESRPPATAGRTVMAISLLGRTVMAIAQPVPVATAIRSGYGLARASQREAMHPLAIARRQKIGTRLGSSRFASVTSRPRFRTTLHQTSWIALPGLS